LLVSATVGLFLIPSKPSDHLKTDRRDAGTLAFALRAGQLTGVHVPTKRDESVRGYLRMCEDMRDDLRECKRRILHLLLRRGIRYEQGGPGTGEAQKLAGDPGPW